MSIESSRVHQRCACGSELSAYRAEKSTFTLRGTERVYERPRPFRVHHISLDLTLDHPARSFEAVAELSIERVDAGADRITLDAVGFDVKGVEVRTGGHNGGWRAAPYVYDGNVLEVPLDHDRAGVRVSYAASPRRGMYFLAPDEHVQDRPRQVWTQCQDEDARHIFPCHDKPHIRQTMDVRVQAPAGWFVLSNGDLVGSERARRRGEFRYRMQQPLPSYLFTIAAGEFVALEDKHGDIPVTYFVPPGREEDGWRTFGRTPEMIRLFAELSGTPYPWTKYAQIVVSDFIFGGMENTGATTMYEHILLDERAALDISSDDLIAHELAHQWFGDLVTCRDWSHAWLNEGFATFMEHVWREHHLGRDEYLQGLRGDLSAYLSEADSRYVRPVVCQDYDAPIDIFDRHLYEKGALTLHALRAELGHDVFWRGVRLYLARHAGGVVETRDLWRNLEEVSGRGLEQFFEQAVLRPGHPRAGVTIAYASGLLTVAVKQTLDGDERPYAFDIDLDIASGGARPRREVRRVTEASHTFAIPLAARPDYVVVDPELRVIGRLRVRGPADMLQKQLESSPTARGRTLAADALGKRDDPPSIRALGRALAKGREFWGVRAAAALALGNIRSAAALAELGKHARTRNPKVRRAVMQALGSFRDESAIDALERAARHDPSILVAGTACRSLGATRHERAYDILVSLLDRDSWGHSLRSAAIQGLARLRDERAVDALSERSRYGYPMSARRAAIAGLPQLSQRRPTRELLEGMLEDPDPHVRVTVVNALGEIDDSDSRGALSRQLDRDLDGRVRRRIREALRDLGGSGSREVRKIREDVDQLRRDQQELKARLSKLEAKAESAKHKKK